MAKDKAKKIKRRSQRVDGYLLAMFGASVGIDCVPFLSTLKSSNSKQLMQGREDYYTEKSKKKK